MIDCVCPELRKTRVLFSRDETEHFQDCKLWKPAWVRRTLDKTSPARDKTGEIYR